MNTPKRINKFQLILLLFLVSFPAAATVLFTPALPSIAKYFGIKTGEAQLTVTFFLVGFAIGQLPYGPLSNRFGRKPLLAAGLILAGLGSLLCVLAGYLEHFSLLVFARFITALGASAGLKIVFTMIGDIYVPPHSGKIFSYTILAYAIMPGIATAIGGFLMQNFHWQSCFYFLSLYSFLLMGLSFTLPETKNIEERQELNPKSIFRGYLGEFSNAKLLTCAGILGFRTSFIYIFAAKAPFISMNMIGLKPAEFGLLSLVPPIGMILGTFGAVYLINRIKQVSILLIGVGIAIVGTLCMMIPFTLHEVKVITLFIPMFIIDFGLSLIYANASSIGLAYARNTSNGSAVINFVNLGISVLMVLLIEAIAPDAPLVMPLVFGGLVIGILILWMKLHKFHKIR